MRDLLLHLAIRLGASDPDPNSALTAEFRSGGTEEMLNLTPSIQTEIEANMHNKDLNACLSSLLPRLRMRKLCISLDTDTIQLTCSLLRFDHAETAMRLRSVSDAQNLVDLIDELINNKHSSSCSGYGIETSAVYLALEICARVPVLPRSLFLGWPFGSKDYAVLGGNTELLFQTAFMCKILDSNYILRVSKFAKADFYFVIDNVDESKWSLSQWRKMSMPSSVTRIRVMLDIAKAFRYLHSMGIVPLYDTVNSDYISLDSEFHARIRLLGLTAHYVKVTPIPDFSQKWFSYEANIFYFGCLFYEVCFDSKIDYNDRIANKRDAVASRPSEPEILDDEWQLIQRCCASDPKSRPTMDVIVREMEAWDTLNSGFSSAL
ncbi:hypothetical protein M378DRAFT_953394 [Amanita muscaria Koide BX008]|uniref:Serine-threonine/tyrosine-protein kinase catalytic domain-containing protein n=1 Tax=Amanita muscaria (strain Koide BX008) TaxID=946122 RepID=A0A0C2SBE9_AMAMK|nr:hypothetical protein M378DRAFT_953394 [Amanita muscaria Koide BX008]